jgi:hypothetical protein
MTKKESFPVAGKLSSLFRLPKLEPGPKTVRGIRTKNSSAVTTRRRLKNYFFDLVVFLAAGFLAGAFFAAAFFAMALVPPFLENKFSA